MLVFLCVCVPALHCRIQTLMRVVTFCGDNAAVASLCCRELALSAYLLGLYPARESIWLFRRGLFTLLLATFSGEVCPTAYCHRGVLS